MNLNFIPSGFSKSCNHYAKDPLQFWLILSIIFIIMPVNKQILLPSVAKGLGQLGENIKLARLRRRFPAGQVAERAGISRPTLHAIEKGSPGVAMGAYAQVLFVLGLEKDLQQVAADDALGRKLQDAELVVKERAPKKSH